MPDKQPAAPAEDFTLHLVSFGHKHGLPAVADLVLDARLLPNPYWVEELRPFAGTDPRVAAYVLDNAAGTEFMEMLLAFLRFQVAGSRKAGRESLTVAVGCTGGRHRSVAVAESLCHTLAGSLGPVVVRHRDLDKE